MSSILFRCRMIRQINGQEEKAWVLITSDGPDMKNTILWRTEGIGPVEQWYSGNDWNDMMKAFKQGSALKFREGFRPDLDPNDISMFIEGDPPGGYPI